MTQTDGPAGRGTWRHTMEGISTMTTTWTWRDAPHDPSILGGGRLAEVELLRAAALREAAAAREGERHRRTMRSRMGAAIVAIGMAVAGGAADVRVASAACRRASPEIGAASHTA
jgi:hypothetical protein